MRGTTFVLILSVAVLLMSGCVSTGRYKAKEQESLQLGKSLEDAKNAYGELQAKNNKLQAENIKLKQTLSVTEKISSKKESESPVQLSPVVAKPVAIVGGIKN